MQVSFNASTSNIMGAVSSDIDMLVLYAFTSIETNMKGYYILIETNL